MRILILWMMVIVIIIACLQVHDYWQVVLSKIGFTFNSFSICSRHQFHCKVISYFCRDLDHLLDLFIYGSNLLDHQRMSISRLQFHIKSPQKTFVTDIKDHIERESLFGWIHLWLTQHSIWKFLSNWERCKNTFLWSGYHPSTFQLGFCDF